MRQNASPEAPATCLHCQAQFTPRRPWQRFDKSACRRAFHKANGKPDQQRLEELEKRVSDLEAQMAMVRGHLVL
jgi:hypothetical protein